MPWKPFVSNISKPPRSRINHRNVKIYPLNVAELKKENNETINQGPEEMRMTPESRFPMILAYQKTLRRFEI